MGCGCLKKQNVKIITNSLEEVKKEKTDLEGKKKEEEEDKREMNEAYKTIHPSIKYESSSNLEDSEIQISSSKNQKTTCCHFEPKSDKIFEKFESKAENMELNKKNKNQNRFSCCSIKAIKLSNNSIKLENKI